MKSRPHDDAMAEVYRADPAFALDVINAILKDGNQAELLIVLRQMTQAQGGVPAVAERARLNPTQLYRTLSSKGNPVLSSLLAILKAMGLQLSVEPIHPLARASRVPPAGAGPRANPGGASASGIANRTASPLQTIPER